MIVKQEKILWRSRKSTVFVVKKDSDAKRSRLNGQDDAGSMRRHNSALPQANVGAGASGGTDSSAMVESLRRMVVRDKEIANSDNAAPPSKSRHRTAAKSSRPERSEHDSKNTSGQRNQSGPVNRGTDNKTLRDSSPRRMNDSNGSTLPPSGQGTDPYAKSRRLSSAPAAAMTDSRLPRPDKPGVYIDMNSQVSYLDSLTGYLKGRGITVESYQPGCGCRPGDVVLASEEPSEVAPAVIFFPLSADKTPLWQFLRSTFQGRL